MVLNIIRRFFTKSEPEPVRLNKIESNQFHFSQVKLTPMVKLTATILFASIIVAVFCILITPESAVESGLLYNHL